MEQLTTEPQRPADTEAVTAFVESLNPALAAAVREIRMLIMGAGQGVGERIKWKHPAFYFTGPMPPADPKAYAREIAVFNLYKGRIMLVFTHGAGLCDPAALLEGSFADGRRTITFRDADDVRAKAQVLQALIRDWVSRRNYP